METSTKLEKYHFSLKILIVSLMGLFFAVFIIYSFRLNFKWKLSIFMFLIVMPIFFLVKKKQKYAIIFLVLTLPLSLDFYIIHFKTLLYSVPISGFRISLFDLVFFYLFISWIFQLSKIRGMSIKFFPSFLLPFIGILFFLMLSSIASPIPFVIKIAYLWYAFINLLVFIFFANNLKDAKTIKILIIATIASGVIQSLLAIGQYFTGSTFGLEILGETERSYSLMTMGTTTVGRVAGTLGHPNRLSSFLGWVLTLNLAILFTLEKKREYILYIFSLIIMLIANFLTFSRGGWVSFVIAGAICCYWSLSKKIKKKIISGIIVSVTISLLIASAIAFVKPVKKRFFEYDFGAAATRLPLVQVALKMIEKNPFLGVGIGSFNAVSHKYDRTRKIISYSFPAPVHNEYLLIASELGIPSLALFLIILSVIFRVLYKLTKMSNEPAMKIFAIGFFCSWIGWCLHRMIAYDYVLLYPSSYISIGAIFAMYNISIDRKQKNEINKQSRTKVN